MATITGKKAGTTTITATYGGLTDSVTLTVTQISGSISYSASPTYPNKVNGSSATTLYCTYSAASASSTDQARTLTISSGPTSSTGQSVSCDTTPSVTKGGTLYTWTNSVSSDGKTITVPQGTTSGDYSVTITARAAEGTGYYNAASTTATFTISVTSTSISSHGDVSSITFTQNSDFPAGGVTITSSNVSTYYTPSATQVDTYNNGATQTVNVSSYSWSGNMVIPSLGTTSKSRTNLTGLTGLTCTATRESKSNTGTPTTGYQAANTAGSWSASFTTQPTWNDITAGGAAGARSVVGVVTIKRQWTSASWESYTTSPDTTTYGSWSYSKTNGSSPNGLAINSSNGSCTATSLGTTLLAERALRGTAKLTFTANSSYGGNSVTATSNNVNIYQAANTAGSWSASFTTQPTWNDITAGGAAGTRNEVGVVTLSRQWTSASWESYTTSPDTTTYGSWSYSKTNGSSPNGLAINSSNGSCTATSLGTTPVSKTKRGTAKLTFTANSSYGGVTATSNNIDVYQAANSEDTSTHYKNSTGTTTGDNWTYNIPNSPTKSTSEDLIHGGTCTISSSVNNNKQYWLKWSSGSYKEHNDTIAGSVGFAFETGYPTSHNSVPDYSLGTTTNSGNTYSVVVTHVDMGAITTDSRTDTCYVYAYNTDDTSKKTTIDGTTYKSAYWNVVNTRTKVDDGYKSYGSPVSITIGSGITAGGGSATITIGSVTDEKYYHYEYTDSAHNESKNAHSETVTGSARWRITNQYIASSSSATSGTSITRFSMPSTGSSNLTIGGTATATYESGTSVSHSNMTTNTGYDFVTVTAYNILDTTKTASASTNVGNSLTWSNPVITKANSSTTITSDVATVSLNVNGSETFTFAPSITQSGSYTSGSTASNTTGSYTYSVTTSKDGYSLSNGVVSVTNNTSTSARNGFVVKITATGSGSKTDTASVTFNQVAGVINYYDPVVNTYTYDTFTASGATKTPNSVTYSQLYEWNNVANSGGTLTTGGTASYSTTGTLPSGFSTSSDFATTGSVVWANRTTTTGNERDAKSNLQVTITMNGKTSSAKTCTSCVQQANTLTWDAPVITKANSSTTITSDVATVSMDVTGGTFTFAPAITQSGSYTSGSTASNTTATYTYDVTTAKTGYSLSSGVVSIGNNTSTSARNGFVVKITATGNGSKTDTASVTFNQVAGTRFYEIPVVSTYSYADFAANGGTKTPSIEYSQVWTWNNVANSGGTLTTGGTASYSTTGTLPSGFSTSSDFATTGSVVWANRTTTTGNERDAKSNLQVTITMNGKTSSAKTCTSCKQVANAVTGLQLTLGSNAVWDSTNNKYNLNYNSTASTIVKATYTSGSVDNNFTGATITSGNTNIVTVS